MPTKNKAQRVNMERLRAIIFQAGFASIFLINFVNALIEPESFRKLLVGNILVPSFLPSGTLVDIAGVNDLVVGLLILSGWQKKWVYTWAAIWLLIVAATKLGHFVS